MYTLPIEPESLKNILLEPKEITVDLKNSKLSPENSLVYLTNLQVEFRIEPSCSKEIKFKLFDSFLDSKYKTNSLQLTQTLVRMMFVLQGKDLGEGPDFLTLDEINEYLCLNQSRFEEYIEYFDSMKWSLIEIMEDFKKNIIDVMVDEKVLTRKTDENIGVNVMRLSCLTGFLEDYLAITKNKNGKIIYDHSMKAGEHVFKNLSEMDTNSGMTLSLLFALSKGIISSDIDIKKG